MSSKQQDRPPAYKVGEISYLTTDTPIADSIRTWLAELDAYQATAAPADTAPADTAPAPAPAATEDTIRMYRSLSVAMLSFRVDGLPALSLYRLWLLMQLAGAAEGKPVGRNNDGYVSLRKLREIVPFGERNLQLYLSRGEGIFWRRFTRKDHTVDIRITGRAALAAAAGVTRFNDSPIERSASCLFNGMKAFRQAAYSTFDAARKDPRPTSRATKTAVTSISAATQRKYEKDEGITATANYHIISDYISDEAIQDEASFKFTDYEGRLNKEPGHEFIAARLPNTYQAPGHIKQVSSRANKRLNQQLKKLYQEDTIPLNKAGEGSDIRKDHGSDADRLFFDADDKKWDGEGYGRIYQSKGSDIYVCLS